ncbi:PTS beta-glucoside transporter subunit IIC [Erysipelotrichaceae bacterium MTC7]|nr:PTS beta-glucoside transporter subunit IIC [Erysipelotrichaceae bacterium MTC7]
MEKLVNNPFLVKLQEMSQKLGSNKFIASLTAGMMSTMSIIMIGAICQIICAIGTMAGLFTAESAVYGYIYAPYNFTMNLLGIWVTLFIAYNYAKNLKMKMPFANAIDAGIIFVLVCAPLIDGKLDVSFLGSTGMFVGFIISFVVIRVEKFCADRKIRIPMPDVCPDALVNSFSAIIPFGINVIIFQGLNVILSVISAGALNLPTAIMAVLMVPLGTLTSLPGIFVLCFVTLVLWCFGIHGGAITYPIVMASMLEAIHTNALLHEAGLPLVAAPVFLYGAMAAVGGTGNPLPLSLLGLKAKSKQVRAIAKVGVVPGWFNITEPVIFGMPIIFNPILCIPFVLNSLFIMVLFWIAYQTGFIIPPWIMIFGVFPMGFGTYFGTLNIMNVVFEYLCIIPSALVWWPFLKIYDNQLYLKEQAAEAEEQNKLEEESNR